MCGMESRQGMDEQSIEVCVGRFQTGQSLERQFYTSEQIYQQELEKIWGGSWIWAGHISQLANKGDYFLFEVGSESVIVVRDGTGAICAHLNVCRHRGSRICLEPCGNLRAFSCPYHAWTYSLNGDLRSRRMMPDGFDRADHGLLPVKVIDFQGLIFICLSETPPPIEPALERLAPMTAPFQFENLKIAHHASYPVPANWKLALENYLECYHCAPAHKEYSKSHSLKDPAAMTPELIEAMQARSVNVGLPTGELNETGEDARAPGADVYYRRYPLFPGYVTGSRNGEGLAPLLGNLTDYDGGATDIQIGPLNNFLVYSDYLVGYRFVPTSLQTTDIQTVWLVRSDAEEGRDYDLEHLTWLWHVTTLDDERIIRHNQEGVNSLYYRPGPLSSMEWGIVDFHHNYLKMLV
ncbi:aromatic ring-hydroxylating dioxygenase subunit alpha [Pelagibius sp. Alg239-R121]|uniref:aromatic ring-hydroxylating oxygenase subunit alpha n=1 Tax=Pelagibius sp. Alg239-R121 TaxID=2993448 RepID=UPI0024A6640E|nr:aromatic ring-hydroxylating dioxygenase subunit alpha [Pelagibius sp. Alg239-R121]